MDDNEYLFSKHSAFAVVDNAIRQTTETLKRLTDDQILNATDDAIIEDAVQRCTFPIPVLLDDQIYMEEREVELVVQGRGGYDIFQDRLGGGQQTIKQHVVQFHVPFQGNGQYFHIEPSSRSIPGPRAQVKSNELLIEIVTNSKRPDQVKAEFEETLKSIKQHLKTLERDLAGAPTQMTHIARSYVPNRRSEILRNKNLAASLGYPMKRRPDAPTTYKAPEVKRKVSPVRPPTQAPFKPEPALEEAEYQHILSVMDNMTKVMERSPHTFAKMEEEDIRQHYLVQLNGQYEGQATGETFNAEGKTDILIRSEGRNIFIAECKIWRGEKSFTEAVDQLLGYLTWRDTKTALVIFNKNKNLTAMLEKIREAMAGYLHVKRGPANEGATRFRYVLGNPNDADREIIVTVMVYDIPEPS